MVVGGGGRWWWSVVVVGGGSVVVGGGGRWWVGGGGRWWVGGGLWWSVVAAAALASAVSASAATLVAALAAVLNLRVFLRIPHFYRYSSSFSHDPQDLTPGAAGACSVLASAGQLTLISVRAMSERKRACYTRGQHHECDPTSNMASFGGGLDQYDMQV